jgi:hypothetical protein
MLRWQTETKPFLSTSSPSSFQAFRLFRFGIFLSYTFYPCRPIHPGIKYPPHQYETSINFVNDLLQNKNKIENSKGYIKTDYLSRYWHTLCSYTKVKMMKSG